MTKNQKSMKGEAKKLKLKIYNKLLANFIKAD